MISLEPAGACTRGRSSSIWNYVIVGLIVAGIAFFVLSYAINLGN